MSRSILSYFPYAEPRPVQREALLALEENWKDYDVFVVVAPTAFGKTSFAKTIVEWQRGQVAVLTPNNMLVKQFGEEFDDITCFRKAECYTCHSSPEYSCRMAAKLQGMPCRGCQYSLDRQKVLYRRVPLVCNYHMFIAMRLYRRVLVVDEAHNLIPVTADLAKLRLWHHKIGYPRDASREDLLSWTKKTLGNSKKKTEKKALQFLLEAINYESPQYIVTETEEDWSRGGVQNPTTGEVGRKGEAIPMPGLNLVPVDIRDLDPRNWFFPDKVEKVILMSATISKKDIEQLGLDRRRVLYIQCGSPIPVESRPVVLEYTGSVNKANLPEATATIARYLEEVLLHRHVGEKGIIHATYEQARILRSSTRNPRLMFHTSEDKASQYRKFRDSPPEEGAVLVASGMYEGIDLPEDAGRWQVVAKVPWKSLGSPAIVYLASKDPEWYLWETLKQLVQACGRICRTPEDYGVTYCLDSSIERLLDRGEHLLPDWYKETIVYAEAS